MPPWTPRDVPGLSIAGTGVAFPPTRRTNADVLRALRPGSDPRRLAFGAAGFEEQSGIGARYWAHEVGQPLAHADAPTSASLGAQAAAAALADAGIGADAIDVLLCVTSTPHRMTSTMASAVSGALGTSGIALDLRSGCCGSLFALGVAAAQLAAGAERVLLVAADTFSKVVPPTSATAALSLADGAGAVVLHRREGAVLRSGWMRSDGSLSGVVSTPGPLPPTVEAVESGAYHLAGNAPELERLVPELYGEAIRGALAGAGLTADAIDRFIPHQPSPKALRAIAENAGIAWARTEVVADRVSNPGSGGWLIALDAAHKADRIRAGDTLLIASVGGGMSWGGAVWTI